MPPKSTAMASPQAAALKASVLQGLAAISAPSATTARGRAAFAAYLRTSPGQIAKWFAALVVLAIVVAAVQLAVISHIRTAVQTIGVDTKPSITAADRIAVTVADMDAATINDALTGSYTAAGTGVDFRHDAAAMSGLLTDANRNITFDATEVPAIDGIQINLGHYYEALGEVRGMAIDSPRVAAERLKWASRVNRGFVAPFATDLEKANYQPMAGAYTSYGSTYVLYGALGIGAGLAIVLAMIGVQARLARRTGRRLNGPMAVATGLMVAAQLFFGYAVVAEHRAIVSAKEDAFNSIEALYGAKVAAYRINADESMWLLDPGTRAATAASFADGSKNILTVPDESRAGLRTLFGQLGQALDTEEQGDAAMAISQTPSLGGFAGAELDNITFGPDERRPATKLVEAFLRYRTIDTMIRKLENAGYHSEAVALDTGTKPGVADWLGQDAEGSLDRAIAARDTKAIGAVLGTVGQSDWAFAEFGSALDATLAANDSVFDAKIGFALRLLMIMPWVAFASLALAAALSGAGLWQRYQEYR
jgi:hypothetical protein